MAHKKGGSTTKKNRDSISKRLGVKIFGGSVASPGNIVIRQKGNKFYPGSGTKQGGDYTIFATSSGKVEFKKKLGRNSQAKTVVNIV